MRHLYIHVPFCTRRCSYCDFAIAVRPEVPADDYLRGLSREIELAPRDDVHPLETIYLGGGTPSRLGTKGIERLMDLVRDRYPIAEGAELISKDESWATIAALRPRLQESFVSWQDLASAYGRARAAAGFDGEMLKSARPEAELIWRAVPFK